MSNIPAPSVPTGNAAQAGAGAGASVVGQVTVLQLPDKLAGLTRALAVSGMVTDQQGNQATVRTAAGDVQVRTEQALPTDRPLTLQIPAQTTGAATTATVLAQAAATQTPATSGNTQQTAATAQAQPQTQVPAQATVPQPAASLPTLQVGTTLAAVMLSPPPASTSQSAPTTAATANPSTISQGLGLGLIVGAQGDTGDQPDLTDDTPRQSNSQTPTPPANSSASSGASTSQGGAPPAAGLPALTSDVLANATDGLTPSPADDNPPSLADLLPDLLPSGGQAATGTKPGLGVPANFGPSTPTPAPTNSSPTSTLPPASPPMVTPDDLASAAPSTSPQAAPTTTSPAATAQTPPQVPAPPIGRAAALLAALGDPGLLPDLAAKSAAANAATAGTPSSASGLVRPVVDETPFVPGSLFLNARPGFVRTGLPSGTTAPFSPVPASGTPSPATMTPAGPGATTPGTVPAMPSMGAPNPTPGAFPINASPPGASPPASPPLAMPTGQGGPSPAMGGGTPLSGAAPDPSSPQGANVPRGLGMTPAVSMLPGALAPQAAALTDATGPTATAAPAAGAYTSPLHAPANPSPGQTLSFTLVSIQRPDAAVPTPEMATDPAQPDTALPPILAPKDQPPALATIKGTVVALTRSGQPVVETPRGTFLLQARTDLPVGTKVELAPAAAPAQDLDAVPPAVDPLRGRDWPALREALAVIAASNPALAHQLIDSVLPRPTPQLTKTLVVFLAALRGGDASGWLGGEAMSTLSKAGRGRLSARLTDDFNSIAAQAAEPSKEGWRTYAVPFGDEVGRLQVHVRAVNDEDEDEEAAVSGPRPPKVLRRFLIDLQLSQLGAMQLDGLIWTGRFDMVIRTRKLLPSDLTRELHSIYSNSLMAVGYSGTLAFQTGAHGWVEHAQQQASGGGVMPATRI